MSIERNADLQDAMRELQCAIRSIDDALDAKSRAKSGAHVQSALSFINQARIQLNQATTKP